MAKSSMGFKSTGGSWRGGGLQCDGLRCSSGPSCAATPSRGTGPQNANAPWQSDGTLGAIALPDAHCHVAFMEHPAAFTEQANTADAAILSVTVAPEEFRKMKSGRAAGPANESVRVALGLHPWWVPENEQELDALLEGFDELLPYAQFIGEVGLDFSKRRERTRAQQLKAFRHITSVAAGNGTQALSLHCVGAYPEALHELEVSGCAEQCRCIFHWFSGSSQQLNRAIDLGCWFSVGERMLQTKRGREYAKAIPQNRLLLETDAPTVKDPEVRHPAVPYSFAEHQAELHRTLQQLANLRKTQPEELAAIIRTNTQGVLGG